MPLRRAEVKKPTRVGDPAPGLVDREELGRALLGTTCRELAQEITDDGFAPEPKPTIVRPRRSAGSRARQRAD
jgi:hypothetical protein